MRWVKKRENEEEDNEAGKEEEEEAAPRYELFILFFYSLYRIVLVNLFHN